jgi:lactaldehyde dehydrogenase/glycolaldehyde dehydrogenase
VRSYQMYIDGEFLGAASTIPVINPATAEVIAEVPSGTATDADAAVLSAERARKQWRALPAIQRAGYLREIAAGIRKNRESLADTIAKEQGKILSLAQVEVDFSADYVDYMAEFARRYEGEIIQSDRPGENILLYKMPIGVIAGVLPWNFPFFLIVRKLAPALVTGNTIVIKPSSETPVNACAFAQIVSETSLPKGVFNLATGLRPREPSRRGHGQLDRQCGRWRGDHARCRGQRDEGLARAGRKGAGHSHGRRRPGTGGQSDPRLAHHQHRSGVQLRGARLCSRVDCCGVHRSDDRRHGQDRRRRSLRRRRRDGAPRQRDSARARGGGRAKGGSRRQSAHDRWQEVPGQGRVVLPPTVLTNCGQKTDIMQKEVFGPVLPIATFSDLDEAIELANDCEYGHTSSIYTHDLDVVMRACNEIRFGETYVNRENFEAMQGFHAGWRKSGIGGADGKHGLEEYLQTHVVYMSYDTNKK